MKEIDLPELKELTVSILENVHEFCIKNNIYYSLSYGTLIGAIRHKGYIPWDDDIDIIMPRPDYERFLKTFNGTYEHLYVISPEINPQYYMPYANVCDNRTVLDEGFDNHHGIEMGIKIDIFPIDGVSDDDANFKKDCKKINYMRRILWQKKQTFKDTINSHRGLKSLIKQALCKAAYVFVPYERIQKQIREICLKHDFNSSEIVDAICFNLNGDTRVNRSILSENIEWDFEGRKFMVMKEYDKFLRRIYGDYMQLPPEEKRVSNHNFTAYWK